MSDRLIGILMGLAAMVVAVGLYLDGSLDPWINETGRAANAVSQKIAAPGSSAPRNATSSRRPVSARAPAPRVYGHTDCGLAQGDDFARIETVKDKLPDGRDRAVIYLINDIDAVAVTASISGENVTSKAPNDVQYFSQSGRYPIAMVEQADINSGWKYTVDWKWRPGAVNTGALSNSFRLPFATGATFTVSQGFNGRASHSGNAQYAVDFPMPVGTPIHAARGGIVVAACGKHDEGGNSREFLKTGNSLSILHEDGSLASYGHLREAGIMVQVGDQVDEGELIAYSGNTGYSSGPHLHFQINEVKSGLKLQSVPFRFRDAEGEPFTPRTGKAYTAGP